MIGVSLRAEELRGKVAGYYIDKIITKNQNVEGDGEKTTEELEEKMVTILANHKHLLWNEEELKEMAKEQLNGKTKK